MEPFAEDWGSPEDAIYNEKHVHCEHNLNHCGNCDVAYCVKCSKEWGANSTYTPIATTTWADTASADITFATICSHAAGV